MSIRLLIILFSFALAGCQSPRTSYMNGVVVWCSTSAIGFGFGEYIEVPAGGELYRTTTNSTPCVWKDGAASGVSVIDIRNSPPSKDKQEKQNADKAEVE